MHNRTFATSLLAAALAVAAAFTASAQSGDTAAKEKELAAAREQLQQAAKRVAELSRELGRPGEGAYVIDRRVARKPALGVLLDVDGAKGVRVSGVTPDSGAAKAGLRSGDRIVSIGGRPVTGATGDERLANLRKQLGELQDGRAVQVGYERDGRTSTASVMPRMLDSMTMFAPSGSVTMRPDGTGFMRSPDGRMEIEALTHHDGMPMRIERRIRRPGEAGHDEVLIMREPGVAPAVRREVFRITQAGPCRDGEACEHLALAEAFRWNGLNLASVDAQLGHYFGTNEGVLVVSTGRDLAGLQAGDVIRKVDGRSVAAPRDVMDVLRGKAEGAEVAVEYLRDRKVGSTRIKVPKAMRFPIPPAPPAPPALSAPPAPPAPPVDAPMPVAPPPPPPAGMAAIAPVAPAIAAIPPLPRPRRVD